jgi:hypothetical protein
MDEGRFVNYYKCPEDGTTWAMTWSCMCDDRCPTCNREIVPYKSHDLTAGRHALEPSRSRPD